MAEDLRQFVKITGVHHLPGRKSVTQDQGTFPQGDLWVIVRAIMNKHITISPVEAADRLSIRELIASIASMTGSHCRSRAPPGTGCVPPSSCRSKYVT